MDTTKDPVSVLPTELVERVIERLSKAQIFALAQEIRLAAARLTPAAIQHSEQRETVPAGECNPFARALEILLRQKNVVNRLDDEPLEAWAFRTISCLAAPVAAPVPEAKAEQVGDFDAIVNLMTDQKEDVKKRDGDWWRGYEAALHWIAKAINEKKSEANHAN